ncbi:MAG: hypothetical protein JWM19_3640 [Actinomycetia bacterium]|nr:hypothetical protein [Actinomycetes bacterium]
MHPVPSTTAIPWGTAASDVLFSPGPRLGWVFRDRREMVIPYPEPPPDQQAVQASAAGRVAAADRALSRAWRWAGKPSIGVALVLMVIAGCAKVLTGSYGLPVLGAATAITCLPGLCYTGWCWRRRAQLRRAAPEQEYRQALAEWDVRAAGHAAAEEDRIAAEPEWGTLISPARRTDVFGGTLAGWQGLLTVHGASLLAERPVLVADLSGQRCVRLLMTTAHREGVPVAGYRMPRDLGRSGLLAELPSAQLATAIAEAVHAGGAGGGGPGMATSRADRALDIRVLQQLAGVLAGRGVTPRRLAAAVRCALGGTIADAAVPGGSGQGLLPGDEADLIAGDLFPTAYRQQVMGSLVRLDAVLAELAACAADGQPGRPGWLTCLVMDPAARSPAGEVLTSLIVQWLTVQVAAAPTARQARPVPAVIIAGADEVPRAHAERLSDACEMHGVPLTLMFRHLRDDAASLLGGGTAAFMRLGNHAEAEQAASYLGRRHTFVMSSFTATRGGSRTATQGTSDSHGTGKSSSGASTGGWSGTTAAGPLAGTSHSGGRTTTTGTSSSRTWGTSWSEADGTSWSDAAGRQRVYEFAVEPTVLQGLPDHALLVADRSGQGLRPHVADCDPDLCLLVGTNQALGPPGAPGLGSAHRAAPGGMAPSLGLAPRLPGFLRASRQPPGPPPKQVKRPGRH